MPDIVHDFFIKASTGKVFDGIATPAGLDKWWTEKSSGKMGLGEEFKLEFGPEYVWKATVTKCVPPGEFELVMTNADDDWKGTKVGFQLKNSGGGSQVRFYHIGWPEQNEHYRISCFCWAMYLRILKLSLENGLAVPYKDRLNV